MMMITLSQTVLRCSFFELTDCRMKSWYSVKSILGPLENPVVSISLRVL